MTAFDAALRSPNNPDALNGGRRQIGNPNQCLLSDEWGLNELPAGDWSNPLAGNVGGQWRVQEVHTPDWILDVVREALGGEIDLDPCAPSNPADWFAKRNMTLPAEAMPFEDELSRIRTLPGTKDRQSELTAALKPYYLAGSLRCDWGDYRDRGFINPPFGFLEEWIPRVHDEATRLFRRMVGLWPVRTRRTWWMDGHKGAEIVCLHYDVKFKGHTSAFPDDLCLAAFNCRIPNLGSRETGRWRP